MKVKIISSDNDVNWYRNKIGEVFEVKPIDLGYQLTDGSWISTADCIIVPICTFVPKELSKRINLRG